MKPTQLTKAFPMFLTDKLSQTKTFYRDKLGFEVTIDIYLQVALGKGVKGGRPKSA